jgi:hypothetical protein
MQLDLDHAHSLLSQDELARADELLERSIAAPADAGARLQRFHAAVLLARTHARAAFGAPFLPSAGRVPGAVWVLDEPAADRAPSQVAHCVAALRWVGFARRWYDGATASPDAGGEQLLPAALADTSPRDALAYVQLAALACYARLRFPDRVESILAGMDELGDPERCDAELAARGVEEGLRPWIYSGVFEHVVKVDEPRAFKFAMRALESATRTGALGAREHERVADWVSHGSRFVFRCPTCKTLADPLLFSCSVCRRPTSEFEAEPRELAR